MTTTYYKAVRPDGTDFLFGTVQWDAIGSVVRHPLSRTIGYDASIYLSVSTVPTDCAGMKWPCRLLTVEPVSPVVAPDDDLPHQRAAIAWRFAGELDPHIALGPQGHAAAKLIDRASHLTVDEANQISAIWNATWGAAEKAARTAAWTAARRATRTASWVAARSAGSAARTAFWVAAGNAGSAARTASQVAARSAGSAARDAAQALIVRDLISDEHFQRLTQPWRDVVGSL